MAVKTANVTARIQPNIKRTGRGNIRKTWYSRICIY